MSNRAKQVRTVIRQLCFVGRWRCCWPLTVLVVLTSLFAATSQGQEADERTPAVPSESPGRVSDGESDATSDSEDAVAALGPEEDAVRDPALTCLDAHEEAQLARMEGRLGEARGLLGECSRDICPKAIRTDCLSWSNELRGDMPTIVVQAFSDEGDVVQGKVYVGEELVSERLDGRPLTVDPGPRDIRIELADGRSKHVSVVLRQGEKNRLIRADFRTEDSEEVILEEEEVATTRPVPLLTWVFAGTAVVATGVATGFGIDALSKRNAAEEDCAPLCDADRVDQVRTSATVADVSWVVAGSAAVGAVVTYLLRPKVPVEPKTETGAIEPRITRFGGMIGPSSGMMMLEGRF